jgi:hypothetical protein
MNRIFPFIFAFAWATHAATTNDIVSPPYYNTEGPSDSLAPWGESDYRFQQIYAASDFDTLMSAGGGTVRAIAFRMDGFFSFDFNGTLSNVQIRLSTTPAQPDRLHSAYANNIGPDETLVVDEAAIRLFIGGSSIGGPLSFDFSMPTQPFYYNPAVGNLLMDIYVGTGGGLTMDAVNYDSDGVSSIGGSASDPRGIVLGSGPASVGLVTRFTFEPIPEPSVLALLGLAGGTGFARFSWNRRRCLWR